MEQPVKTQVEKSVEELVKDDPAAGPMAAPTPMTAPAPTSCPTRRIRVLVADDQAAVRSGLVLVLQTDPDITVVGEAG